MSGEITNLRGRITSLQARTPSEPSGKNEGTPAKILRLDWGRVQGGLRERYRGARELRGRCREIADEVVALPESKRKAYLAKIRDPRKLRGLAEEILKRSRKASFRPQEARALNDLAWSLIETIPDDVDEPSWDLDLHDLRVKACAYRANVHRIGGQWEDAEALFQQAFSQMPSGSGDMGMRGEILDLYASLLKDRRRFDEALEASKKAGRIYESLGEELALGKVLINRAGIFRELGDVKRALDALLRGCVALEEDVEPELTAAAWNNLALYYCELGRYEDAVQILGQSRYLEEACGSESTIPLFFAWVRGHAFMGLGRLEEAEATYLEALKGFEEIGFVFDVAFVSLDLAILYLQMDRLEEVETLACRTYALLEDQKLHEDATAALTLLSEAARERRVARAVIQSAVRELRRWRPLSKSAQESPT